MAFLVQGKAFGFQNVEFLSIAPAFLVGLTSAVVISVLVIRNRDVLLDRLASEEKITFELKKEISERRQTEETLQESEARFRTLASIAPVGIFETDADGLCVYVNDRWSEISGLSGADAAGEGWITAIHPEDQEMVFAKWSDAAAEQIPFSLEYRFRSPDGKTTWVFGQAAAQTGRNNTVTGFVGSITDISDLKNAEMARRETEGRFRGMAENAPWTIFLKDLDGRFSLVNPRFESWYGIKSRDIIGKTSHDIFPKEYADEFVRQDEEVAELRETREYEVVMPFPDGTTHSIQITKFPVISEDGELIGVGTINTDVTDQRLAETKLLQAQKMEAVGQLTGGVAHDFNNLLTVIQGNAELLGSGPDVDGSKAQAILRASERGAELTHRLLAFSRQQPLHPRVIDLADLLIGISGMLERTLGETIEIKMKPAAGLWPVMADPGQLENALLNLAINGRDAMPGGGRLTFECTNAHLDETHAVENEDPLAGDYVVLAVSDTGTGMTAEVMEHAFEPFFTTKEVGEGSGLGLSMVYGFTKQSGGKADISSEGPGTTVKLYLPRGDGDSKQDTSIGEDVIPLGRGESILVIEDDDGVRRLTVTMLKGLGYRVIAVPMVAEARSTLEHDQQIDLVLTDVVLPGGVSGPEFAEELKIRYPDLKIVFMSGYPAEAAKRDGFLDPNIRLVAKPFRIDHLATTIREALD